MVLTALHLTSIITNTAALALGAVVGFDLYDIVSVFFVTLSVVCLIIGSAERSRA